MRSGFVQVGRFRCPEHPAGFKCTLVAYNVLPCYTMLGLMNQITFEKAAEKSMDETTL